MLNVRSFNLTPATGGLARGKRRIPHLAPDRRRQAVEAIREKYQLSERHACRIISQPRGTQRYIPTVRADEDALTRAIVTLASEYGRYGYRRITALLQISGWRVGKDRVQRVWRREGLKVPRKQRPKGRLWFNDGSCVRLRPERPRPVWSYDFVSAQTHDGRSLRLLTIGVGNVPHTPAPPLLRTASPTTQWFYSFVSGPSLPENGNSRGSSERLLGILWAKV